MAIDLASEAVVTLTKATKHFPERRSGKKPHPSTLFRWARAGVGGVRLEPTRVGGPLCASLEAIQRFAEALSVDPPAEITRASDLPLAARTRSARDRDVAAADRTLDAL